MKNLDFCRKRGFGILTVSAAPTPLMAHVPFCLDKTNPILDLHLLRSNPIVRSGRAHQPSVMIVSGPDSYVSPDWYDLEDQVPTWNYVAVHLFGTLERLPHSELRRSLEALSDLNETKLAPKPVWKIVKVTPDLLDRMMKTIVPYRLTIERTGATWKLGQNKPEAARLRAAERVGTTGHGQETRALSGLMSAKDDPT